MLDYFKRFFAILFGGAMPAVPRVLRYAVDALGIREVEGGRQYLWLDVNHVSILTTSDGPFAEDLYFVIKTDSATIIIDHTQASEIKLFDQFAQLPGFSYEQTILAMGSTNDAVFVCFERELAITA